MYCTCSVHTNCTFDHFYLLSWKYEFSDRKRYLVFYNHWIGRRAKEREGSKEDESEKEPVVSPKLLSRRKSGLEDDEKETESSVLLRLLSKGI